MHSAAAAAYTDKHAAYRIQRERVYPATLRLLERSNNCCYGFATLSGVLLAGSYQ
jgi:hypothetical protein